MGQPARADSAVTVIWEPRSKPQEAFIACPVFEVFFGGARGSLKTDSVLGDWLSHSDLYGKHAIGLMVRRELTQLTETYERAKAIFLPLGFKFQDQQHTCVAPNGARLRFAYLERDQDAEAYQGHSYTRVYVEEIGNFPTQAPVMKLMATLRSAAGVPCGFRATGNPGGPGHHWVKARYIDPAPTGWKIIKETFINPWTKAEVVRERVFIPGKITDHTLLGPEYVANLQMSGSESLVRAWLEGDWSVIEGAFFAEFSLDRHVIEPCDLPKHWARFRSFDWGSAKPFSVGWWAIASDDFEHPDGLTIPRNSLVRYREWYGAEKDKNSGLTIPNVGLKLTAEEVAAGIKERTKEGIGYGVADPSIFKEDGGPSIGERMNLSNQIIWKRADNKRVAGVGHVGGWDQLRQRLKGIDGRPLIYCFSTCVDSIRTIPALQHDSTTPEDLDSSGEDHAADEWRYACMSRIIATDTPQAAKPQDRWTGQDDEDEDDAPNWRTA